MTDTDISYTRLKRVEGWLSWVDHAIFRTIVAGQAGRVAGALAEIGVHHGKSFVPLAAASGADGLYAIDLFEDQGANLDRSGKGDLARFEATLAAFGIDRARVTIDARPSSEVAPRDILDAVGPVRFFHIDGGHHLDAVVNDIDLAVAVLHEDGVIAIDDVFRPEWPEVSMGAFGSRRLQEAGFACFAIGFNKAYFCRAPAVEIYRPLLEGHARLGCFLHKRYRVGERAILVYQKCPLPEWSFPQVVAWYLGVYHPLTFLGLVPAVRRIRRGLSGRA